MKRVREFLLPLLVVALIGLALTGVLRFRTLTDQSIRDGMGASLSDLAREQTATLIAALDGRFAVLRTLGGVIGMGALPESHTLTQALNEAALAGDFSAVGYVDATGLGRLADGGALDLTGTEALQRAALGQKTIEWKKGAGRDVPSLFQITQPVMVNGTLKLIMVADYGEARFVSLLASRLLDAHSYAFLTDSLGEVMIHGDHDAYLSISDNMLEFLDVAVLENGDSKARVADDLLHGRSGSIAFGYGNQYRYATYAPLGINDWFIFNVLPGEQLDARRSEARDQTSTLAIEMIGIVAIALTLVPVIAVRAERERKRLTNRLEQAEALREAAEQLSNTILFEADPVTGVITFNDSFERQLGRKPEVTNIRRLYDDEMPLLQEDKAAWQKFADEMMRGVPKSTLSVRLRHASGARIWYRISFISLYSKERPDSFRIIGRIANVETQDCENGEPSNWPDHDSLTGILGHAAFMERAEHMIRGEHVEGMALLIADIDGFKEASDPSGARGDRLIVHMAERIKQLSGEHDLIGRMGGDTFAILMTDASGSADIARRAAQLTDIFDDIPDIPGGVPTCSVGVALVEPGRTIADLSHRAGQALYRAKLSGKHRYEFTDGGVRRGDASGWAGDISSVMLRCATALINEPSLSCAMDVVLRELVHYYQADRAYVLEYDPVDDAVQETYALSGDDSPVRVENRMALRLSKRPMLGRALTTGRPVVIADIEMSDELIERERRELMKQHIRAIFLMPMLYGVRPIGFIGIDNPRDHIGSVTLLKTLANSVSNVLARRRDFAPGQWAIASDEPDAPDASETGPADSSLPTTHDKGMTRHELEDDAAQRPD